MKTILLGLMISVMASAQMIDASVETVSKRFNISSFGDLVQEFIITVTVLKMLLSL